MKYNEFNKLLVSKVIFTYYRGQETRLHRRCFPIHATMPSRNDREKWSTRSKP